MGSRLLLLSAEHDLRSVLPALDLLPHTVRIRTPEPAVLVSERDCDAILVDARSELAEAKALCKLLSAGETPVAAIVVESALLVVTPEWGIDEILLPSAGPAEVDARLRMLQPRSVVPSEQGVLRLGDLVIDEHTYTAKLRGRALELTYKEFELLKHLAQHEGRVFTRAQLLSDVWGYDFFGGARTVDVHVRRLRAKLGPEHEQLIGTVRSVGYKFVGARVMARRAAAKAEPDPRADAESEPGRVPRRATA